MHACVLRTDSEMHPVQKIECFVDDPIGDGTCIDHWIYDKLLRVVVNAQSAQTDMYLVQTEKGQIQFPFTFPKLGEDTRWSPILW